jgi:hypothetical protein
MGCLSTCQFSNWAQNETGTTGKKADPRSFCIQKTLQKISHSDDVDFQLMFAGHNAYRFATDPFYADGNVPSVKQLVERLVTGGSEDLGRNNQLNRRRQVSPSPTKWEREGPVAPAMGG